MNKGLFDKISSVWQRLVGDPSAFSLENRVFNSVSVVSFAGLVGTTLLNFYLGLPWLGLLMTVVSIIQAIFYYLSRFKKVFQRNVIVYAVISYVLLIINYFYNSGINGPTIYWFFLTFNLLVAISSKRFYLLWAVFHLLTVWVLLTVEYHFLDAVPYTYHSKQDRFTDILATYIVSLTVIFLLPILYVITINSRRGWQRKRL